MRLRLFATVVAVILSYPVFAKTAASPPAIPQMLTARQLLALTPPRRMAYFIHVRKMLLELAQYSKKNKSGLVAGGVDAETYKRMLEQVDHLARLVLPEAQADDREVEVARKKYADSVKAAQEARAARQKYAQSLKAAEEAAAAMQNYADSVNTAQEVAAARQKYAESLKAAVEAETARLKYAQSIEAEAARQRYAESVKAAQEAETARRKYAESVKATQEAETARQKYVESVKAAQEGETARQKYAESVKGAQEAENARQQYAESMKTAEEAKDQKVAEELANKLTATSAPVCPTSQVTCDKSQRSAKTKAFRDSTPSNCIFGGNMSEYENGEIKEGNCASVSNYCFKKDDCDSTSKDIGQGFKSRYTCRSGYTVCSPFIFGLKNPSTPICVKRKGQDITENCDKEATRLKSSGGYVQDFLNKSTSGPNGSNGVAEAWDEYANSFNKFCQADTLSRAAHCEECAIIARRLGEANMMATGKCDTALKSNERTPGAPPTEEPTTTQ